MKRRLSSSIFLSTLTTLAFANHTPVESVTVIESGKCYVGVFGGGGSSNHFDGKQFGTAFFIEAQGGPLAVNAFGQLDSQNTAFFGIQLGYQAQEIFLNSAWTFAPAVELEGYMMNRRSFEGDLINDTERLPEHDFFVSYPMNKTVFLANAVFSFNNACYQVHPYFGLGIGSAIVRIRDANAAQVNPLELGINHYNANNSDTSSTFAGQVKLGLSYDINACLSLFADYRWLYLARTDFVFGSTIYPTHAPTSSWLVKLDAQRYNLGNIGLRYFW